MARRVVLALLVLALVLAVWWWHEPVLAHARVLNCQRQCGIHTFRPEGVVASSAGPGGTTAAAVPAHWTAYEAAALRVAGARGFTGTGGPNPAFSETLVFLHRRRSPAGRQRVVAIRCLPLYLTSASVLQAFQPVVVEPAKLWPLSSRPLLREGEFHGGYPVDAAVQVFGGQPDPADPSHFTIAYTVNGQPGVIDAHLRDDDTVRLQVRAGSADVYPPP